MNTYTILLLYPDWVADQYGEATFLTYADADTPAQAVATAQLEAVNANTEIMTPEDSESFALLLVAAGHVQDLSHEVSTAP